MALINKINRSIIKKRTSYLTGFIDDFLKTTQENEATIEACFANVNKNYENKIL